MHFPTKVLKLLSEERSPALLAFSQSTHLLSEMASTYLTKAQRQILINEYIECEDEVLDGNQCAEETRARLSSLNNVELINECVAFMPDCLDSL